MRNEALRAPSDLRTALTVPWWKSGVLYQVYVRSFADSNGDGVGDLPGLIQRLDHLAWLGVDGIWLSPITVSPNRDWGYDVADYLAIQPEYGTFDDFDRLIREANRRNIRVILDMVPNHTSDQHPWFVDSRSSRGSRHRDWYVWVDPRPNGSPPNNWLSTFGGPAWTLDQATGQMYLHNFASEQPDLNWWNDEVRAEFDRIMRFWLDRGAAGFRIDVCHMVVKDRELRDNPPAAAGDGLLAEILGQRQVYNADQPELHDVIRRWRQVAESYDPPAMLFGETVVNDLERLGSFYGEDDQLHLALNVPFQEAAFEAEVLRQTISATRDAFPAGAWPIWSGSNHDVPRLGSRWADGDPQVTRAAIVMLLTLQGTPLLYQGDEIGLPDTALEREDVRDPVGELHWPVHRDGARTPMPWSDRPGGGFTAPEVEPWLPFGDLSAHNVEAQRADGDSVLNLTRDLLAYRRESRDLQLGDYEVVETPDPVWAWRRGRGTVVALNLGDAGAELNGLTGRIAISTRRTRDGEAVAGLLALGPWEAVVVEGGTP